MQVDAGSITVRPVPTGEVVDFGVLSTQERRRMASLRRSEDRIRYGYAHVLLREVIAEHLHEHARSLLFARDVCPVCGGPHGRPVLAVGGRRPLEFSLSHGGDHVAVGIAERPIGVDVQPCPDVATAIEVAGSLHPAERTHVQRAEERERPRRFARIWTRKEAYLKAIGCGLSRRIDADDLTSDPPGWSVTDRAIGVAHHLAVVVREPSESISSSPRVDR